MFVRAMRTWEWATKERPIGIGLLTLYCFYAATRVALHLFAHPNSDIWKYVTLFSWLVIGIGLYQLAKWAWILCLLCALTQAFAAGYFAWIWRDLTGESTRYFWRIQFRDALIYLFIALYLLERHVRSAFFRPSSKSGAAPDTEVAKS